MHSHEFELVAYVAMEAVPSGRVQLAPSELKDSNILDVELEYGGNK